MGAPTPHPERAAETCQQALSIVLERNLLALVAYITTLLRLYGSRTAQNSTVEHSRYAFGDPLVFSAWKAH